MSSMTGGGTGAGSGFWLMDADTANMLGYYESLHAALRDVADVVRQYGPEPREVQSLVLYQEGGLSDDLNGPELVHRAMADAESSRRGALTSSEYR